MSSILANRVFTSQLKSEVFRKECWHTKHKEIGDNFIEFGDAVRNFGWNPYFRGTLGLENTASVMYFSSTVMKAPRWSDSLSSPFYLNKADKFLGQENNR